MFKVALVTLLISPILKVFTFPSSLLDVNNIFVPKSTSTSLLLSKQELSDSVVIQIADTVLIVFKFKNVFVMFVIKLSSIYTGLKLL